MRDLGQSWGVDPSTVCRAIKEAKRREVAVSEAIRAKMAREPAAECRVPVDRPGRCVPSRRLSPEGREFSSLPTTLVDRSREPTIGGKLTITGFQLEGPFRP